MVRILSVCLVVWVAVIHIIWVSIPVSYHADPKVTEHELTPQGRIYQAAGRTDEKVTDIAPDFRGTGATPQQKEDDNKPWISSGHTDEGVDPQNRDEHSRPQGDTMAQGLYNRLGPFQSKVIDPVEDGIVAAKERVSGVGDANSKVSAALLNPMSNFWGWWIPVDKVCCCVGSFATSVGEGARYYAIFRWGHECVGDGGERSKW